MLCLFLILPVLSSYEQCSNIRASDECVKNTPWTEERVVKANDVEDNETIYTNPDDKANRKNWYGKVITYRFLSDSGPICSAMKKTKVREEVDRDSVSIQGPKTYCVVMWNPVPEYNILITCQTPNRYNSDTYPGVTQLPQPPPRLQNVEDIEAQTESTIREDIRIRFAGCVHPAGRLDEDPDYLDGHGFGESGEYCEAIFGHAFKFGDVHLNTLMTWTDEQFDKRQTGSYVQPYFYTIVLHELGHSLGLDHLDDKDSVMYWNFGGLRKHQELKLSQFDMRALQQLYGLRNSQCADTDKVCAESYGKTNGVNCSDEAAQKQCPRTCKVCELCRELPDPNLVPMSWRLPLLPGETITVECGEGYELQGNSDITCLNGEFVDPPTCVKLQPNCRDKDKVCARKIGEENGVNCKKEAMKKKCPRTCGVCGEVELM
eukprot:sb/3479399/